ncbi:MAG: methyltransferase domain-containing protein [Phycisphaerales bacterium]
MFRYARLSDYPGEFAHPILTKRYQERFLADWLPRYCPEGARVLEVGANENTTVLSVLPASEKWIADPYSAVGGSLRRNVPDLGPGYHIARCAVGENSNALPSDFFDLVFSSSVLEHIGQEAAGFDCRYTPTPPEGQETPRNRFCEEVFRILKPGGVTIHTIDHAVRNLTFDANFRAPGFEPLLPGESIDRGAMMDDADALRQTVTWTPARDPLPPEKARLHSVLIVGYRKPVNAPARWARIPAATPAPGRVETARNAAPRTLVSRLVDRVSRTSAGREASSSSPSRDGLDPRRQARGAPSRRQA